jgi:hypothetical protein
MRRIRHKRPSAAMIVALLALFISLGGASYAVVTLPEHSVGPRQLQRGAVTPRALGFPLGATTATDSKPRPLLKTRCDSPPRPGEGPVTILCPKVSFARDLGQPSLHIHIYGHGHVLIYATLGLEEAGSPNTGASIRDAALLDGRPVLEGEVALVGGERENVPLQALISVGGGSHVVGVAEEVVRYTSYESREVVVSPVTVAAVLLP